MTEIVASADLANRIHSLVRSYALVKTKRRCGINWEQVKVRKVRDPETGKAASSMDVRNE